MYRATHSEAAAALAHFEPALEALDSVCAASAAQRQAALAAESEFHATYTAEQRWNDPMVYALYNEMMARHKKIDSAYRKNELDRSRLSVVVRDLRIARDR
jgi:hypothetical protein